MRFLSWLQIATSGLQASLSAHAGEAALANRYPPEEETSARESIAREPCEECELRLAMSV